MIVQNEVIKLIKITKSTDEYGDTSIVETERVVFAKIKSVKFSEFYQAMANGMKAEITFELSDYTEYSDEERVKYQPFNGSEEVYSVIRTYRKGNVLELTCKKGVD